MSMEVRKYKQGITIALMIAGLVVAIPLIAGEDNEINDLPVNPSDFIGYRGQPVERVLPPYMPPHATLAAGASLTPENVSGTRKPGETLTEKKNLWLEKDVKPAKVDIMFTIDVTGSMKDRIDNVKAAAIDIMMETRALIADSHFGIISHMDYLGDWGYCQYAGGPYGAPGGVGQPDDYPYSLDQPLTGDMTAVQTAINGLPLGQGEDFPESYARCLYECYSDAAVGWRADPEVQKIVVVLGDALPHDCNVFECIGDFLNTGRDPGRDEVTGNMDDLLILEVIDGLKGHKIMLIPVYSGDDLANVKFFQSWECWAAKTGGAGFRANGNGTIPGGGEAVAQHIASLLPPQIAHIKELKLEVCDPAWAAWFTYVDPAAYSSIDRDVDKNFPFDVEFTVPAGTPEGDYCFDVCAMGDGQELDRQHVCIHVPDGDDDCIHLEIGDVWGDPGDDICVPVYIEDVTGWDIFAFDMEICWCETPVGLIQFEGCTIGEMLTKAGWSFDCGPCSPFCITAAGAGASPLSGGGELFCINFHISNNAKPGMCCEICIEDANLYDPEKPLEVCLDCAEVCINACGIGGTVFYWPCIWDDCCGWIRNKPIRNVMVHLYNCEGPLQTLPTNPEGEYWFPDLTPPEHCPYCVQIDFCAEPKDLVNALDASLVLQYTVCKNDLDRCTFEICGEQALSTKTVYPQRVAADVNCTGEITALDASEILRYAVGKIEAFACPDPWEWFLLKDCDPCTMECPYYFDWVGVFIGDVSGGGGGFLEGPAVAATASIGTPRHYKKEVRVPVVVEDAEEVFACEFEVSYNQRDFEVLDVEAGELTQGFFAAYNDLGGTILIAFAGSEAFEGSGKAAEIVLQRKRPRPFAPMALPRVHLDDGILNEGTPPLIIKGSDLGHEIYGLDEIDFGPVKPNPFADETTIFFALPEARDVDLAVYNVNGQLVRTLQSGQMAAGRHQVIWNGRDNSGVEVAKGVYFCRISTGDFSATEKIIILE